MQYYYLQHKTTNLIFLPTLYYVKENSDINIIYPINELKAAKKYWQIYYKYDTHWNNMGAFVGVQSLYKALDIPMTNPLNVEGIIAVLYESDNSTRLFIFSESDIL